MVSLIAYHGMSHYETVMDIEIASVLLDWMLQAVERECLLLMFAMRCAAE